MTPDCSGLAPDWLDRWQHQAVRDLAWVIASPPLVQALDAHSHWPDAAWCRARLTRCSHWLDALDRDPAPLQDALATQADHRLGHQVETLLAFWLGWPDNPDHQLVARNVAIRTAGVTQGELDFLVRDRHDGRLEHWEVAVKFYLGRGTGRQASDWVGPGLRDRLDLKLDRLCRHQLRLAGTPAGRATRLALGLDEPLRVRALVKGRLFHAAPVHAMPVHAAPDVGPAVAAADHLRGWWCNAEAFPPAGLPPDLDWVLLPKAHWLTPVTATASLPHAPCPPRALLLQAADSLTSGRAQAVIGLRGGREVTRGFIAPGWSGG